jgi:hypothetical protein
MEENKIEQYLIELKYSYQELKLNFWLLDDTEHNLEGMMVIYADPLVIVRVQVMDVPIQNRERLYTKLLELNAGDMIHGAYGLEGDKIVIIDTLEYETLDFVEFRAVLDAISLALTQHYPILSVYRDRNQESGKH